MAIAVCATSRAAPAGDADSRRWLAELREPGRRGDSAVAALHELLLKMAYARLLGFQPPLRQGPVDELANEAADEAVVGVLVHLDEFRGLSKFTTWACQFAVTEVSVAVRRYRRRTREVPAEPQAIVLLTGGRASVESDVEHSELLQLVCEAVDSVLSERQRRVLVALAVDGDSPATLAGELGTSAGALYKSLHDARQKLLTQLADRGFALVDAD